VLCVTVLININLQCTHAQNDFPHLAVLAVVDVVYLTTRGRATVDESQTSEVHALVEACYALALLKIDLDNLHARNYQRK